MKFNFVSKNSLGCVIFLLLVIMISQAKMLNFLIETPLGRSVLILFILFLSYSNKILGVVGVLLVILMFNSSDFLYLEGFDTNTTSTPSDKTTISDKVTVSDTITQTDKPTTSTSTDDSSKKISEQLKKKLLAAKLKSCQLLQKHLQSRQKLIQI